MHHKKMSRLGAELCNFLDITIYSQTKVTMTLAIVKHFQLLYQLYLFYHWNLWDAANVGEKRGVSVHEALKLTNVTGHSGDHTALSIPSSGNIFELSLDLVNVHFLIHWNY